MNRLDDIMAISVCGAAVVFLLVLVVWSLSVPSAIQEQGDCVRMVCELRERE